MKKKILLRPVAAILSLVLLCCSFVGCAAKKDVVRYENLAVTSDIFNYLCSLKKTEYLYDAYQLSPSDVSSSQLQDNELIWATKDVDNVTVADHLKMAVLEEVQSLLYFAHIAVEQGYTLNSEQIKILENGFKKNIVSQFETKKEFNDYMKNYGITYDGMLEYYKLQTLAEQGTELLFGEAGTAKVSDEAAKAHFNKSYITMSAIFINTKNKTYPNGKVVLLPESEKAEKLRLVEETASRLAAGEDFAALCEEVSDAKVSRDEAEKGATILKGSHSVSIVNDKLVEMKTGEYTRVDVDDGVYFIKRLSLDNSYFESEKEALVEEVEALKRADMIAQKFEQFVIDEAFVEAIDVAKMAFVV